MRPPDVRTDRHSEVASKLQVRRDRACIQSRATYCRRAIHLVRAASVVAFLSVGLADLNAAETATLRVAEPTGDASRWTVEQMSGGTVTTRDGALIVDDAAGCTVWYNERIVAPVEISYDVTVVFKGGPHDRVSDVNCFWMAQDPRSDDRCPFTAQHGRSGKFSDYDSLFTYYVGMGGNENTTTRFRRYNGTSNRPLLPEHDLRDPSVLLEANRTYHIRLVARDGVAEYWRDGKKLFSFDDPQPLTSGWFAIRTIHSHLEVRNLRVNSLNSAKTSAPSASAP